MRKKKYNHSFARRMTWWVMLVLFVMMSALGYLIYDLSKNMLVEISADTFHSSIQASGGTICHAMSDVSVAVKNNIFDIERNLGQPNELQAIVERIVAQNPRVRSCGISFIENYYPMKGRTFCPYAWRRSVDGQADVVQAGGNTTEGPGDTYLEADWFIEAVAADSAYWSDPFFDSHEEKTPLVAYMYPIHDKLGRVVAVLGADLSLDFMTRLLQQQDSIFLENAWAIQISGDEVFSSYVLSRDGTYITHPDKRRIMNSNFFVHIKDADKPGVADEIIWKMKNGRKSNQETDHVVLVNRQKTYLFYAPLEGTQWILAVSVPIFLVDVVGIIAGFAMLLLIAAMLMVTFLVCRLAIRHVARPLKQLAAAADEVAGGQFNTPLPAIASRDEIGLLRDSFENMQHSLTNYMEELKSTTAAKASIESELKIAHDIQMSMLPMTYPAFPDRHDIDVYGMVMPAKAVGGDLYDFFIRDDKLFFCIGDVSGKGVPASLVMAVTRSLFRNIAAYTQDPDHIVLALNNDLSNNNDTGMFVTLFLGVLDLNTGHLSYANAGHNPPLLMDSGEVTVLECDPNVPIGVMPCWKFSVQHLDLKTGDGVFLYTDGLNEAEDASHRQFGMDRMLQVAKLTAGKPQNLIEAMKSTVQLFVGDAEQSDDLTMLAIQYTNQNQ